MRDCDHFECRDHKKRRCIFKPYCHLQGCDAEPNVIVRLRRSYGTIRAVDSCADHVKEVEEKLLQEYVNSVKVMSSKRF